jgi:hypothetical protein
VIRRFAYQWFTCRDKSRPSGRSWARQLGISHTWLQKLVREFRADEREMRRMVASKGEPRFPDLGQAREFTRRLRERGELRPLRDAKTTI